MPPIRFRSFRTKLQSAFVLLGLAAIGITGWEASSGASAALQQATYDRLTAIRQTRANQLERYFENLRKHVVALSSDEATITALESFARAWPALPTALAPQQESQLRDLYRTELGTPALAGQWFPKEPRALALQSIFLGANPHPAGTRDLLVAAPEAGRYGEIHARYHPTFHRYQSAFDFYDILLISASEGRILYSVLKEADLGASLHAEPLASTNLARAYRRALTLPEDQEAVLEDYAPYAVSRFASAAFAAAPIRRAGVPVGVLAIQFSIQDVNRMMTGGRRWREEGLGETGDAYIAGPDYLMRSDPRLEMEQPEQFFQALQGAGVGPDVIEKIRRSGTAVLTLPVGAQVAEDIRRGDSKTGEGESLFGRPVLRSYAPLRVAGLQWTLIGEIASEEALRPAATLRRRILIIGLAISAVFFAAAGWLAASVTRPVLALAQTVRRLGGGELGARVPEESTDEIGQLEASFNRMSEDLQKTTVSKKELEVLAGRLISAQEEERTRVARELHDDLTQRLAAVAIEAGRMEKLAATAGEPFRAGLERLKVEMGRIAEDVHGLSRRLHPAILEDLGLLAAIESECRGLLERGGPFTDLSTEGEMQNIPRGAQLAAYRIVQESFRNTHRHAQATEITLRLQRTREELLVEIADNGKGFHRGASDWRPGLGLASMEERARLLGGTFAVSSQPGQGTAIRVRLPLLQSDGEDQNSAG